MKAFVLDCSATVPWIFGSEANRDSAALLEVLVTGGTAWVPALWHLELANVLLGAQRRGRIEPAGIAAFLGALAAFEIEVDPETYEVRADGELLTCAPADSLPLAQRYFLF